MRSAPIKFFYAANKEDLKRRHERRRARAVKNFSHAYIGEIKIMQAEVAQVIGDKMLEQRLPALVTKENFIANEHVGGPKLAAGNFRGKLFRLSKTAAPGH
jgi:hypothetical protein